MTAATLLSGDWLECPVSMRPHVASVLQGEYALPAGYRVEPRTVLDVGANVGAFAVWASRQWPGATVHCYEPHPLTAEMLRRNVAPVRERVAVHELAVVERADESGAYLYEGANNCGEASLWQLGEQAQTGRLVRCISAGELGPADVIKLDTEGCELEILRGYRHLDRALVVMLEWHRPWDRWAIGALLSPDFDCARDERRRADRGIMVWVRAGDDHDHEAAA